MVPFEIKVLAALRHLGRGECWDTIVEACNDLPSRTTLSSFFKRFVKCMRDTYEDTWIHTPRTETELQSVLNRSSKRGFPGCLGYMDGVHVHWDRCPMRWKHQSIGKNEYPSIGWQCSVNHHRRFMSVSAPALGGVNDQTACRTDKFVQQLRHDKLYTDMTYMIYDEDGEIHEENGLWVNVDGGYLCAPELLVGNPHDLDHYMNYWTTFMESERKHVECAFGILKARFRVLKLPIRLESFDVIDNMFVTCCILHNMCLESDGFDDSWNLGTSVDNGSFEEGENGYFSDDDHHKFYWSHNLFYDLHPNIDYTTMGSIRCIVGSKHDDMKFCTKRNKMAKHFYYMFRQQKIDWSK